MELFVFLVALFGTVHSQGHGALRLVRSGCTTTSSSGIVEIYYRGVWGNICADNGILFGYSEANVICHQLGYTGVSTYGKAGTVTAYGVDNAPTVLGYVVCYNSSLLALLQCLVSSKVSFYCDNDRDAFVSCYSTRIWSNPYSGQIRLQGGTYSNYGRLEVYCNSQWGTVCGSNFDVTDAAVACRQLGYDRVYNYTGDLPGSSSQPVWLDNVGCSSSSGSCLAYCQSCPSSQNHNCNHTMDVAIGCDFISSTESSIDRPSSTNSTCQNADTESRRAANRTDSHISSNSNITGSIIAAVVGGLILTVLCIIAVITIPILFIYCGLRVGLGAARSHSVVRTTSDTSPMVDTADTAAGPTEQGFALQPIAYPQPPATSDIEKSSYQPVPAYFHQTAH